MGRKQRRPSLLQRKRMRKKKGHRSSREREGGTREGHRCCREREGGDRLTEGVYHEDCEGYCLTAKAHKRGSNHPMLLWGVCPASIRPCVFPQHTVRYCTALPH